MELHIEKLNCYIYDEKHFHPERCHIFFDRDNDKYYMFNADKLEKKIPLWILEMIRVINFNIGIDLKEYKHKNKFKVNSLTNKNVFEIELEYFRMELNKINKYNLFYKNIKDSYSLLIKKKILWYFLENGIIKSVEYCNNLQIINDNIKKNLNKNYRNYEKTKLDKEYMYSSYFLFFDSIEISEKMYNEFIHEYQYKDEFYK